MTKKEINDRISEIESEIRSLSFSDSDKLRSLESELSSLMEENKRIGYVPGMFSKVREALEENF
jgi:regulator of replication initiation timing